MLREPGEIHGESRTVAAREARFFDCGGARLEHQIGFDRIAIDAHTHRAHGLDDFDRDRAYAGIETVGAEHSGSAHAMLHAVGHDAERAVNYSDVWINSHRGGEVRLALAEISIEEKAVVEIPVAGENLLNRLGRLMNRIVVAAGDHRQASLHTCLEAKSEKTSAGKR